MRVLFWPRAWLFCAAVLVSACGSAPRLQLPSADPPVAAHAVQPLAPPVDAVAVLIANSDAHFQSGLRELALGHLGRARVEFDRALEVLLESPFGGRNESRIREHYDRLVDRISAQEFAALATGDGFTEQGYEPASIDELLATSTFDGLADARGLASTVEADLASTTHDIPIPLNGKVLSYVDLFAGRLKDWVESGLSRGSRYLPMIQSVFRAEGLPLDLAYVPLIESAFKPTALSRAKAKGVWQFMRNTALENGLKHDWYIDERADPEKATRAAARYLKTLHRMFGGDWHLALASYNGGPGRVQRATRAAGSTDFWRLTASTRYLPRETREYVPMILAAIIVARNPAQYGIAIATEPPMQYETVAVPRAVDLRRVAEWAGTTIDEVQSLNPELRRWTTPLRDPDYEVKVPPGTAALLRARLADAPASELTSLKFHTVRRGETLVTVARTFGVSRVELAEANHLGPQARLQPGQELLIPRAPSSLLARRLDRGAPATSVVSASHDLRGTSATTLGAAGTDVSRIVYHVKRGDTLFAIARLFETTVDALKRWNDHVQGSRLTPGDRLTIYAPKSLASRH
jgi:membrane-bound lytic murein transglycosylase D